MSNLNFIQKIKCLRKVSDSNTSLKERVGSIITSLRGKIGTYATTIKQSAINFKDNIIESAEEAFTSLKLQAENAFDSAKSLIKQIQGLSGTFDTTCPDVANNTNPLNPTVNPTAEIASLPLSNDNDINNSSTDIKNIKNLNDAKTKSIVDIAQVIGKINKDMSQQGILEMRENYRQYKDAHPLLNNYINKLSNFQPISPYVGETFIAYTLDKPSLQLQDWTNTNGPTCIRNSLKSRIRSDIYSEIEKSYTALNTKFSSNISNEFFAERSVAANTTHTYHIAGDSLWFVDHVNKNSILINTLKNILIDTIKDQQFLIDYLYPTKENITIENDTYDIVVENNTIRSDKRMNIVKNLFTTVNNNALTPVKPEEV